MKVRIEHADTLVLLRELPDGWAQTCIARPPRQMAPDRVLAILTEVRRVLREDATLWLLAPPSEQPSLATALQARGFTQHATPAWARSLTTPRCAPATGLLLFSKQARCFHQQRLSAVQRRPVFMCAGGSSRHVQRCTVALARERDLRLVKQCVLAGSARVACGACGAPYRPARSVRLTHGLAEPSCQHNNPQGCCLVLDPFYEPNLPTALAALSTGRSFLGIKDTTNPRQQGGEG